MVPTQLPSSLTQLMLFGNDLTGGIPDLSMLTSLERLYLSKNENLGGMIPATLGQLTGLTRLGLLDTGLTGDIPEGLGSLVSLELLDLRDNMLSGSIPDDLGDMSSLKQLYLRENQLDGSDTGHAGSVGEPGATVAPWQHAERFDTDGVGRPVRSEAVAPQRQPVDR